MAAGSLAARASPRRGSRNRRKTAAAAFHTLLGLGTGRKSTEYEQIRGA